MKKIMFLFAALMTFAPIFAQSDDEDDYSGLLRERKHAFFVGVKGGVNFSSMTDPNETTMADGMGVGFGGGLAMRMRFGKASSNSAPGTGPVALNLELKYRQNTLPTLGEDDIKLSYVDVPLTLQFFPFVKSASMNSFYLEAGGSFGVLVGKDPETLLMNQVTYHIGDLTGMDVHPVVGLGYTIPSAGVDLNARYHIGMTELAKNFPCKVSQFELSVAVLFNAAKF